MTASTRNPHAKLLDEVPQVLRLHHYSMHTERSSVEWMVRFVRFHGMRSRQDLCPAEPKIASCLTDLAVHGHVAAAPQSQALHALVFPDTRVLNHAMEGRSNAVRADKTLAVPVGMTHDEVAAVISLLKHLTVRSGKGDKDRFTTLPATLTPVLQHYLAGVTTRHQQDWAQGHRRGLPAPCAGAEVSACRQRMGLVGCLPRPEHLRRPACRCHPPPS